MSDIRCRWVTDEAEFVARVDVSVIAPRNRVGDRHQFALTSIDRGQIPVKGLAAGAADGAMIWATVNEARMPSAKRDEFVSRPTLEE